MAVAVDRVTRACRLEIRHVGRKWAGLRCFVEDRNPVVGFDLQAEGFFWLAGQGGYGIQTAPALSRAAAQLIRGQGLPEDLQEAGLTEADLSPRRIPTNSRPIV